MKSCVTIASFWLDSLAMKRQGTRGGGLNQHGIGLSAKRFALVAVSLLIVSGLSGHAAPLLTLDNPTAFFTNVAARLLRSELSLDLNNIQVYPTNQYTPAVHRLLQVTANIYDAATNRTYGIPTATNGFPTVFRPIFRQTQSGTNTIVV